MRFSLVPYEGALPVRFGMSREEILSTLGLIRAPVDPNYWGTRVESFGEVSVHFAPTGQAEEFSFQPPKGVLCFGDAVLVGPTPGNPLLVLAEHDPEPLAFSNYLYLFPKLGVSVGYDSEGTVTTIKSVSAWGRGSKSEMMLGFFTAEDCRRVSVEALRQLRVQW